VEAKNCIDTYKILKGTDCYETVLCEGINRLFFSYDADESIQSDFLSSCKNMQQSLGCVNMRNHSFCILNQQYAKEEYAQKRNSYDFGSYQGLQAFKNMFADFVSKYPRRYAMILKSFNVTGDAIGNSKNCRDCFYIYGQLENCKYIHHALDLKDSYDAYGVGEKSELLYEAVDVGLQAMRCMFGIFTHSSQNTAYTYCCHGSSNLFGCVGIRSKQCCILNRQYSQGEYEALLPKIKKHMDDMPYVDLAGRKYGYGEFFPVELSPFAYNETIAQEYMTLTADAARGKGFPWKEAEARNYSLTVTADKLPDHIKDVPDSILQEVIECTHKGACNHQCTSAFKLISSELQFYRHFNLSLPRLCPNCRHYERLAKRNPFKLWKRTCQCAGEEYLGGEYGNVAAHFHGAEPCVVEFETPYAPGRPEIVYCEACYQSEIL